MKVAKENLNLETALEKEWIITKSEKLFEKEWIN